MSPVQAWTRNSTTPRDPHRQTIRPVDSGMLTLVLKAPRRPGPLGSPWKPTYGTPTVTLRPAPERVRLDATTSCGYHTSTDDG